MQNNAAIDNGSTHEYNPIRSFNGLPQPIAKTPYLKNFIEPTLVQAVSWPYLLEGANFVGISETGSGKTLAFAIPLFVRLLKKKSKKKPAIRALVICPTRELATQNFDTVSQIGKDLGLKPVCILGGVNKAHQASESVDADIVIGTPGRILDLIREEKLNLSKVFYCVLDEADRMLDKGFEADIKNILSHVKSIKKRQVAFFSATWPFSVRSLASSLMDNFVKLTIEDDDLKVNRRIQQDVIVLDDPKEKRSQLLRILRENAEILQQKGRILIFALYKKEASGIEEFLVKKNLPVTALHGDMQQAARFQALEEFKTAKKLILVATDVAARGLDIPEVKLVINLTFPLTMEDYVHRVGRTGRAGKIGRAITIFTPLDKAHSGALINVLNKANQKVSPLCISLLVNESRYLPNWRSLERR